MHVGRWPEVLVALGCEHRSAQHHSRLARDLGGDASAAVEPAESLDLSTAPQTPRRNEWHLRPGGEAAKEREGSLLAWLRWLADQLPEEDRPRLRAKDFDRYMRSVRRVSLSRGAPLHPPSARNTVRSTSIGTWNRVKHCAGSIDGPIAARRSTRAFEEHELVRSVVAAIQALGPEMTRADYTKWRDEQIAVIAGDVATSTSSMERIPSDGLLRQRLGGGSWAPAIEKAIRLAGDLGLYLDDADAATVDVVREVA